MMNLQSLKNQQTFALDVFARRLIEADSAEKLCTSWQEAHLAGETTIILGGGSNTLFTEDFAGTVILNRIMGYQITEDRDNWRLHIGAGENWHQLVSYTIEDDMPGLENLALIPGCVGAAPIQNIGAYGVEFERFCQYVDIVELFSGDIMRVTDCQFGYRDSIFKHQHHVKYAVIAVGITLPKQWRPVVKYGDLKQLDPTQVTPKQIFDMVCTIRQQKLPNPNITGNAGSFFKNPVVDKIIANNILTRFPNAPVYHQADGRIKFAAGWLIERCGLKGYQIGGAAVHVNQALILINKYQAKPLDIVRLAAYVRAQVFKMFAIMLEPEVCFVVANGEKSAAEVLDRIIV